jgi:hypothetical protein
MRDSEPQIVKRAEPCRIIADGNALRGNRIEGDEWAFERAQVIGRERARPRRGGDPSPPPEKFSLLMVLNDRTAAGRDVMRLMGKGF